MASKKTSGSSVTTRIPQTTSNRKRALLERMKQRIEESGESDGSDNNGNSNSASAEEGSRHEEYVDLDQEIEEEIEMEEEMLTRKNKGKKVMAQSSSHDIEPDQESEDQPSLLFAYKDHIASSIWNSMGSPLPQALEDDMETLMDVGITSGCTILIDEES